MFHLVESKRKVTHETQEGPIAPPLFFTSSTCSSLELISSKTTYLSHVGGSLWFNPESRERKRKTWKVRMTSS